MPMMLRTYSYRRFIRFTIVVIIPIARTWYIAINILHNLNQRFPLSLNCIPSTEYTVFWVADNNNADTKEDTISIILCIFDDDDKHDKLRITTASAFKMIEE